MKNAILLLPLLVALASAQKPQTFTGTISDSMCARGDHSKMRMGSNDGECTNACVQSHGADYVLFDGKDLLHAEGQTAAAEVRRPEGPGRRDARRQDQHDPGRLGQRSEIALAKRYESRFNTEPQRHGDDAEKTPKRVLRCSVPPCFSVASAELRGLISRGQAPSGCRRSGGHGTPSRWSTSRAGVRATCRTRGPCPSSATTTAGSRRLS